MCGIAGYSGRFEPELLPRMATALAHRGPDDAGVFSDRAAEVGLAHRRLSILDLSPLGHQPMVDPSGRVALVFNGEIYNFREIRRRLEQRGVSFRSHTDTEVIVQLYLEVGERFLGELNGVFAIALWDRDRQALFLARDGLGVIPLYVGHTSRGLLFASEIKALIESPELPREIDGGAIAAHLSLLWSPSPRTALASVKKVEPGYAMEIRRGSIERTWQFYELPSRSRRAINVSSAIASVRETVRSAVHRQMVSDVPVGAFLSGGLDSSAVVAFARELTPKLPCFTIAFGDGSPTEEGFAEDLPYARKVAKHLGVELDVVRVGSEMADELAEMVWHLDEPQADMAPLNALHIARRARERGVKVLLSGAGGDDIFTGYRRHLALSQERLWAWLPEGTRRRLATASDRIATEGTRRRLATASDRIATDRPALRRARKLIATMGGPAEERIARYFEWLPMGKALSLLTPRYRGDAVEYIANGGPLVRTLSRLPGHSSNLERMLYLEAKHFLADHNLPYTNKMGMAAGVEVRVPLLDREVVAAAASLPDNFKQHGLHGKWVFKKAMEPLLPKEVIYRPKTGFGVPLRGWLRGPLAPLVAELLSERVTKARGLFEPEAVQGLLRSERASQDDVSNTILAVMCIELWCRRFVGG